MKKTAEELREAADNLDATIKSIENSTTKGIGIYLELETCKAKKDEAVGKGSITKPGIGGLFYPPTKPIKVDCCFKQTTEGGNENEYKTIQRF